jgi:hypothetical protein
MARVGLLHSIDGQRAQCMGDYLIGVIVQG